MVRLVSRILSERLQRWGDPRPPPSTSRPMPTSSSLVALSSSTVATYSARREVARAHPARPGSLSLRWKVLNSALGASVILIAQVASASSQIAVSDEVAVSDEKDTVTDNSRHEVSREGWRAHVDEARKRVRASAGVYLERSRSRREPTTRELSREATERALKDYSLVRGDIVVTDNGIFVFKGRSGEEPKDTDFERLPGDADRDKTRIETK